MTPAERAIKLHFGSVDKVKMTGVKKLIADKKITTTLGNQMIKRAIAYRKTPAGAKPMPKPDKKKPAKKKPESVKEIRAAMKKIPSKSGHKDKPKKEVQKKPPTISGVTWKKNSGGWNTTVMINGKSEFFSFEEDGQILDDDFEEVSLEKFKKIVRASAPKEKPKAKPKAKPKMGKSITIKFDRHGGNWNTLPLEGVGHFKGKDIVFQHKG